MTDQQDSADGRSVSREREIDALCLQFELAWRAKQTPRIEAYLTQVRDDASATALRDLIALEVGLRRGEGQQVAAAEYHERFPHYVTEVDTAFGDLRHSTEFGSAPEQADSGTAGEQNIPEFFGRYRVRERLGAGTFGEVYLAHDPELNRLVALKVPNVSRFSSEAARERFAEEARTAAQLNYAAIVSVYDITRDGERLGIVQEYVAGQDLAKRMRDDPLPPAQTCQVMITVAEAVAYAHQKGFVHRDLKPDNILLDQQGLPHVADFGLSIHEDVQYRRKGERAGTPSYMSPEQVRGETHRLDGRSDLWSLGAILYELLTGRVPFSSENTEQLFDEIKYRDPKPPRQIKPELPAELERICLKCLSKRVIDRYGSAIDLADDLRHWLEANVRPIDRHSDGAETKVVPKGLRSFDEEDADFFLDLLPGPRDRNGLPESVRFWKTRIDQMDADRTFAVGLVYGPSGCGKSSLVKAGLLPRLASHVTAIYVEATAADTPDRLIKRLRHRFSSIPGDVSLPDLFESLRGGLWVPPGKKVLVVLDQFEQWLHAWGGELETPLVQAARHADGSRLQCLVLVRDDFWLATSRFWRALEIELLEGTNAGLVDLFDSLHARKVLAEFGRAYGRLPENLNELSDDQQSFLSGAVEDLAQDGKIVCVQLALLADMMKGRPWSTHWLKQVGGTAGLGVSFLEETFSAPGAPVRHRQHQDAARGVLGALLPESGTHLRGRQRSYLQLRKASGYTHREKDLDELMRILDSELRLVTPTDPGGGASPNESAAPVETRRGYYQLTHDYLVSPLRQWLTRKQKESRRGRAELRLAERSALWNVKPESRHLPSCWEYVSIVGLTASKRWTTPQRTMMHRAAWYHGSRWALAALLVSTALFTAVAFRNHVLESQNKTRSTRMVNWLLTADIGQVPDVIVALEPYWKWAVASLREKNNAAKRFSSDKLRTALALLPEDDSQADYLFQHLLEANPDEVPVIVEQLSDRGQQFRVRSRTVLEELIANRPSINWQDAPLDASWRPPDPSITKRIRQGYGMVSQRFVFCQTLSLEDFQELSDQLCVGGYRPARIRPFAVGDRVRVAAVWTHDGRASEWHWGAADDIRQHDNRLRQRGYQPVDVAGFTIPSDEAAPSAQYAAVWAKGEPGVSTRLYVGVKRHESGAVIARLDEDGFRQRLSYSVLPLQGELESAVLGQSEVVDVALWPSYEDQRHLRLLQVDLQLNRPREAESETPHYTALWWYSKTVESTEIYGVSPEEHLQRIRRQELMERGFRPVCVAALSTSPPELITASLWHRPLIPETTKESMAKRQASAAVAILKLGESQSVWPRLRHSSDPRLRSYLIHRLGPQGADVHTLVARFSCETEVSAQRALLLCLGEFGSEQLGDDVLQRLVPRLETLFCEHPDAGLHAAAEWLLRTWERGEWIEEAKRSLREDEQQLHSRRATERRRWYVTSEGHTMVVLDGGELFVASPNTDPDRELEIPHHKRIDRRFAISATAVTRGQLREFLKKSQDLRSPLLKDPRLRQRVRTDDSPMVGMTWYQAAAYCNWLSEKEGIPPEHWCYQRNSAGQYGPGMCAWPDYLSRHGYRLPSEAEWEFACRANAETRRYYGHGDELLGQYAWHAGNSQRRTWPVARRKPNDFGLFDMHGNVWNWCHNLAQQYWQWPDDRKDDSPVVPARPRVCRGGSYLTPMQGIGSARRHVASPGNLDFSVGLRVARSWDLSP